MNTLYATVDSIRSRLTIDTQDDDARLFEALDEASRALDDACGRRFYPRIATHYFDYMGPVQVRLDDDLLSVTSITTDNDTAPLTTSDYVLAQGTSYNHQPYDRILIDRSSSARFSWADTVVKSQKVVGVWGYHTDYAKAWVDSGTTLGADIADTSTTSITVSDGTKLEVGQTIQADSEWLLVKRVEGPTVTVERAINGSTAATHTNGASIQVFVPEQEVRRIASRFALWLYKQDEAPYTYEETRFDGAMIIPKSAPPEVHRFIKRFMRRS
jgi:hypothetical protein